jgi:hypothetical protein
MIRAEHRNLAPNLTRTFSEQRGATHLIVVASAEDARGIAAADTAIRAVRAGRFLPALVRQPGFWIEMLEHIDTYLSTGTGGGECALGVMGIVEGRILGASVGDVGAWGLSGAGARAFNPERAVDALVGSALAEPIAFGPWTCEGSVLIGAPGAVIDALLGPGPLRPAAGVTLAQALTEAAAARAAPAGFVLCEVPAST